MSAPESTPDWLEGGLHAKIPIVYHKGPASGKGYITKTEALSGLRKLQRYIGYMMLLSAVCGIYMLATDHSLWIQAVSHAAGLVIIVLLDVFLGLLNLLGSKRVYVASLAAAVLGVALQLGDITTAPQYGMTMAYFARYLFSLPAFDLLLGLQVLVLAVGVFGRTNVQFLAQRRRVGRELNYSRRSFLTTMVGFAVLVGFGVTLGSIKIPSTAASQNNLGVTASPTTPITNQSNLKVDSPVYFEYPSGFPNVLFKRSDGTLAAYSMLCTHTCCEVAYEASSKIFFCPCHGSEFSSSGGVIRGPARDPLPSITLHVDNSGDIFPTGTVGYTPC